MPFHTRKPSPREGWPGEAQWLRFRSRTDIQTGLGQRVISNQTEASRMRKQQDLWAAP